MGFAFSGGRVQAVERPVSQAPYSLRLTDNLSEAYGEIWRKQPSVRTVVDFLGRNIAQIGLHVFERVSDTDRKRLTDHPLAQLINRPNPWTTRYRMIRALVVDRAVYDSAFWLKTTADGAPALVRLPPNHVTIGGDNWVRPDYFEVKGSRGTVQLSPADVVYFRGYNPDNDLTGSSPIESLRRALSEETAAGIMREQTLRNGARASGYLSRPKDSPKWSDDARARFKSAWRSQYLGLTAMEAGGTPLLEDGMTFTPASQTAVELQYVESRKLTVYEVARAYFIPPPMIGLLDEASFSNITEQHKMLYQDTLGPWLTEIKEEIELQLLGEFPSQASIYVEFNLQEKLRGSFEEQAAQLQTSVGAPFMTRNEARARANLPRIDGGDALVIPLNVLEGGQASPSDSAPDGALSWRIPAKARAAITAEVKARPTTNQRKKTSDVLSKFFGRQEASIRSVLGAKADADWWNEDRWNEELAALLYSLSSVVTTEVARKQLEQLGVDPDEYNPDQTLNYLAVVARSTSSGINAVTRKQIEAALDEDEPLDALKQVFDVAKSSRSDAAAATLVTGLAGFATLESVKQVRGTRSATKTWLVTSSKPRSSHAAMNGETVPIDQTFSNGAMWPGDASALDVDDIAGCMCDLQIDFE